MLPLEQMGNAAGKLHHFQPAGQLTLRIGEDLAVFTADELGQLISVLLHQLLEAEKDPGPHQRWGLRPVGKGALGNGDRLLTLGGAGKPDAPLLLATGGIEDGPLALAATLLRLAVDEVADPVCHVSSVMTDVVVAQRSSKRGNARPRQSGATKWVRVGPAGHPAAE